MCYTGWTLEDLHLAGSRAQRELLNYIDILIDGPYVRTRHENLLWRGSNNQRIHFLSNRHESAIVEPAPNEAQLEFSVAPDGAVSWTGVPPEGFTAALQKQLRDYGLELGPGGDFDEQFAEVLGTALDSGTRAQTGS